jgi:hypothetical protein
MESKFPSTMATVATDELEGVVLKSVFSGDEFGKSGNHNKAVEARDWQRGNTTETPQLIGGEDRIQYRDRDGTHV